MKDGMEMEFFLVSSFYAWIAKVSPTGAQAYVALQGVLTEVKTNKILIIQRFRLR